jgi:fucose permease
LMPSLREELGLSYTVASLHFSTFAAGMIGAGLVGERIVGRWGRKATFWTGAAGLANLYPLTVSLALGTASDRSEKAGARLSLASGTAILVAPFLLGALADAVGIRAAYTVVPVFLVSALVASRLGQRLAVVQMGASPIGEAR